MIHVGSRVRVISQMSIYKGRLGRVERITDRYCKVVLDNGGSTLKLLTHVEELCRSPVSPIFLQEAQS